MEENLQEKDQKQLGNAFTLESNLVFSTAKPLAASLLEKRKENVVIDASSVEYLGAACFQVLLSAAKTWREDEAQFEIADCSPEFIEGVEKFGYCADIFNQQETE